MTTVLLEEPRCGFHQLNLNPELIAALDRIGYSEPTPIQSAFIPEALTGRDVIGQAQTGTGKTAAFLLPFYNNWRDEPNQRGPQAIVLAPTRELVVQVAEEAEKLSPNPACRAVAIYGGQRFRMQLNQLRRGCAIAVGTPGRVLDHLSRGTLSLDNVRYVVLDEADRMLDIGFRPDIERILRRTPTSRQTLLLSATMPPPVLRLTQRYMIEPNTHQFVAGPGHRREHPPVVHHRGRGSQVRRASEDPPSATNRGSASSSASANAGPRTSIACSARTASAWPACTATCRKGFATAS